MAFQLSPGVLVQEVDVTNVVPAVSASIGGFCGYFRWGPANEVVTISSENQMVQRFGKPNDSVWADFFTAASFLAYSTNLKVVRAIDSSVALNAGSTAGVLITNSDDYYANHADGSGSNGMWAAKYPGVMGNSLKVSFADNSDFSTWTYKAQFDYAPNTTKWVDDNGGTLDELHIIVIDEDGLFSGTAGTVLEKFSGLSKASDAKDSFGLSNYYKDVINQRSQYIWWTNHPAAETTWGATGIGTAFTDAQTVGESTVSLASGVHGSASDAYLQTAYDLFANDEQVDVNLIMTGAHSTTVGDYVIDNIAEVRKDCMVFVSPQRDSVLNNVGSEAADIVTNLGSYTRSSYAVMDSGYKYMYDRYNDTFRWVPCNGDVAGLCARTDIDADPWFSPAGYNRGAIKNAIKLAYSPNKSDRDTLYKAGVNPIVGFPGNGIVLFGDKTMLDKPSAFDRINVRRLFITLEKAIATAAKFQLFEFNDAFTRAQFKNLVEPFLRDVQARRGIYDFRVVCDDTNNTSQVVDTNSFVADIFIQPAKSINFITLSFVATRTGVSFEEGGV